MKARERLTLIYDGLARFVCVTCEASRTSVHQNKASRRISDTEFRTITGNIATWQNFLLECMIIPFASTEIAQLRAIESAQSQSPTSINELS